MKTDRTNQSRRSCIGIYTNKLTYIGKTLNQAKLIGQYRGNQVNMHLYESKIHTDPAFGTKVKVNFPFDSSLGPVETKRQSSRTDEAIVQYTQ